jgi:hypothetical protein
MMPNEITALDAARALLLPIGHRCHGESEWIRYAARTLRASAPAR